jgi:WD40 repeat protein
VIVLQRKGERERIELVQFSPNGQSQFASSYNGGTLWEGLPAPTPGIVFPEYRYIRKVRFSADGESLITDHKGLTIHNLVDGTERHIGFWDSFSTTFDITPDGSRIVFVELNSQANREALPGWLACCPIHDLRLESLKWSHQLSRYRFRSPMCVFGDRCVLTESWWDNGLLRGVFRYVVRSLETGETLAEVEGLEIGEYPPIVSPNGQLIAGLMNARVIILSASDFSKATATLRNNGRKHFTGIAFHPSGRYLAATSNDATVKLYDTATWAVAKTYTWDVGRMRSVAFSPDGTLAAAGSDTGKVVVWDVDL